MDGITAASLGFAADQQLSQIRTKASLVREAHSNDSAIVELLDAAKSLDSTSADPRAQQDTSRRPGQFVNFTA